MHQSQALSEVAAGKIRPVYLIYGGETFLQDELFHALREAIVRPETADFNYHVLNPGTDQIQKAVGLAQTQPFLAERRLVVVRDCMVFASRRKKKEDEDSAEAEKPSGADEEQILAYLGNPVESTCLVFMVPGNIDKRKKVTKAITALGGVVECQALKAQDAVMWAQRRAASYGKRLSDMAANLLVEKVGQDMRLMDTELQKLCLYVGDGRSIRTQDVDAVVGGVAETFIYELTEAVVLKEHAKAMVLLQRTLRQVDHPLQILAALANRFRQVLMVKGLVERGVSLREGPRMAKMHPYPYRKMAEHVRQRPREELVQAMSTLLEADLAIKSGSDPQLTVETVVAQLMQ